MHAKNFPWKELFGETECERREDELTHLEQLDSDDSEEELEEERDDHNVADGFD